jgi:hypothetical protein
LSTLRKADLLVVLRDGRVAEQGSPAELLARDGEYARLWRAQSASAGNGSPAPTPEDEDDELPDAPELELTELRLKSAGTSGLVAITRDGAHTRVTPRRCFPLTDPSHFVALLDERGHERACFDDPSALDAESREALLGALSRGTFLPVIRRILAVAPLDARWEWQVETDRGRVGFIVEQEEHIRALDDGRHLVTDSHGMRYLIETPEALDAPSRRLLARFS